MSDDSTEHEAQEQVIPGVTSGALLDAMEDPSMFEAIARADLYAQLALMRRHASAPDLSFGQRVDYVKFLAKMGKVEQPEKSATDHLAGVPPIQIILPNSGGSVNIGAQVEKDITPAPDIPKPSKAALP
jgi:hypothetical protein